MKSETTTTKTKCARSWQETRKSPTHTKTHLLDYNDNAVNVTNSVFYSTVTVSPLADL